MGTTKRVISSSAAAASLAGAGLLAARAARRYRRDLAAARQRVRAAGGRVLQTARGPVEVATRGEGAPVLVVHGIFGGCDAGLASVGDACGAGHQLIAPSRFGYLGTPLLAGATPAAQADAHAALLDRLGVGRAAVLGYSAGATSAIQLALRHPARVAALALVSPNAPGPVPAIPPRAVMDLLFRTDVAFWLAVTSFPAAIRSPMGVPKGLALTAEDEAEVAAMLRTVLPARPRGPGYLFDAYVSNPDINRGYPFGDIAAPTLVVAARDDPTAPYTNACALAGQIPGARLVTLERGGHLGLGQRERTTRELRAFLREHAGAAGPREEAGVAAAAAGLGGA